MSKKCIKSRNLLSNHDFLSGVLTFLSLLAYAYTYTRSFNVRVIASERKPVIGKEHLFNNAWSCISSAD